MKKILIMLYLLTAVFSISITAQAAPEVAQVISGTEGANSRENAENLLDGDPYTKWCVTHFDTAYVIWEMQEPQSFLGYALTTGNDNDRYPGRNPASWTLYGSNDCSTWEELDCVCDDQTMENTNYMPYFFLSSTKTSYQYFKFEITSTQGADVMQLSEFELCDDYTRIYEILSAEPTETTASTSGSYSNGAESHTMCGACQGNREVRCISCAGDGIKNDYTKDQTRCWSCGGTGRVTCSSCGGRGWY